jgi:fumarate hydratase class II
MTRNDETAERFRIESDSLGEVAVPADKLWGAETQRSLEHFSIGDDLIPREMIGAYATLKKAAAIVNRRDGRLSAANAKLIVTVCDEILAGKHADMFPLHVWMTGSGTQFNMNVNEVISNRASELAGTPLGSKTPVHPNDHVNMSQSSNDSFPSAMYIAAATGVTARLLPAVGDLRDALRERAAAWEEIIKIGRTHLQDATPLTLGQEFSGYVGLLEDDVERIDDAMGGVYRLSLGGTAVGTGINSPPGFDVAVAAEIASLTGLPFVTAPNKFTVQGSHDAIVHLSATLRTLAVSLFKIANDIRLLSAGPRAGIHELILPANEPGSSIMPGKVNPTQCEALTMIATQVIGLDVAVALGGGGGHLEMNVYKPLMIHNVMESIRILADGMNNFRRFLVEGVEANTRQIAMFLERSLMLVTALSPAIGYDEASKVANYASANDTTLREAALVLGAVSAEDFDRLVDPRSMLSPIADTGASYANPPTSTSKASKRRAPAKRSSK